MPMDWEKWQEKRSKSTPPPDLEKVVENFRRFRGRLPSSYIILIIVILAWILSGIYIVAPDEVGVVKRFGAYSRTTDSGPHYHLPYPIETVLKPKVTQVRRFEIGFRTINPGPPPQYRAVPEESLMLTGDENIIDLWFIVQYKIKEANNFLFKVADPYKTIRDAAEAAMREVMGKNKIDEALTAGKFQIQSDAGQRLQEILDSYESGFHVIAVQLQAVHPPEEVRDAFRDVASAREDQNRFINEAEGYANDILPKAEGEAARIEREAEGYREARIKRAQGDAARFTSLLKEYQKAKDVTRKRLYLETMEKILSEAKVFILGTEDQQVLPFLPLQSLGLEKAPAQTAK